MRNEIHISCNVMGALDAIFARAIMARDQRAVRPKLNEEGRVRIVRGRHPLIARDRVYRSTSGWEKPSAH
ncbi:MAG: hypothetical protein R2912_11760 [Eubacteriales bacterium]